MKKTLLLIALFISLTSCSQSNISEFVEYKITGFGSIKIPPTMELRTEKTTKILSALSILIETDLIKFSKEGIVFQQKGFNDRFKTNKYARIMIKAEEEDNSFMQKMLLNLSEKDLRELNKMFKDDELSEYESYGIKIKKWYPVYVKKVNGKNSLVKRYVRESAGINKNDVYVEEYLFGSNKKVFYITLTYRMNEGWDEDFKKIGSTIKID